MLAPYSLDSLSLSQIIEVCGRTMGIDIINIRWFQPGILKSSCHTFCCHLAVRCRTGDMISIRICTITNDFSIDVRTTLFSMLQCFHNNNTSALTHNETTAVCIKWTGSMCRIIIVVAAQCLHRAETCYSGLRNAGLCATSHHNISIPPLKHAESITNVISTSCTSCYYTAAWPLQSQSNGNMTSSHITNHHRNKEWTNLVRSLVKQLLILTMHGLYTTDTTTYEGTDTVAILSLKVQLGIFNSHLCCSNSKLGITVDALSLLLVHVVSRIKIFYLTSNLGLVLSCIKAGNLINTIFAFQQGLPKNILAGTNWADYA